MAQLADYEAVGAVMAGYFDGLHHGDTSTLAQVFHPQAHYACATGGTLLHLGMDENFAVVDKRPSPASRGEARHDRILAIEFGGPAMAFVKAACTIAPKSFIDFLTLVKLDGRWQVMSKVFHCEITGER
jgi:hypothetical protein